MWSSGLGRGGIVNHHCLNFLCFVDIGGIVDHHCLNFLYFADIGGVIDHHCLNFLRLAYIGGIMGSKPYRLDNWISKGNSYINKQLKTCSFASTQKTTYYHKYGVASK
jgi:hypothetical protein